MSPLFNFRPYQPANTSAILELIVAPARARAAALRAAGEAQARAAQASGQAWAGAAQNIGQIAGNTINGIVQYQQDAPRREAEQIALRDAKRREAATIQGSRDAGTAREIQRLALVTTPDGVQTFDRGLLTREYAAAGIADRLPPLLKSLDDADLAALNLKKAQQAHAKEGLAALLRGVRATGATPEAIGLAAEYGAANGFWSKEQSDQIVARAKAEPANIPAMLDLLEGKEPAGTIEHDPTKELRDKADPTRVIAPAQTKPAQPVMRVNPRTGKMEQIGEAPAGSHFVTEPAPVKVNVGGAGTPGGLTDEGVEYAATQYRVTGAMPPMGMGGMTERAKIINTAAKQAKALGQSPAQAIQRQYALKADSAALNRMSTMKSAAESFEAKAQAQAGKVVELSAKVGRSQWPIVNAAIMAGKTEVAGNADATLLLNAVLTFTSEYAKIIEGSTGSAQGSSDAARRATEKLLNPKFNHSQVVSAVDLMKWEMEQTIKGYDATIMNITERMGGAPQVAQPKSNQKDPMGIR